MRIPKYQYQDINSKYNILLTFFRDICQSIDTKNKVSPNRSNLEANKKEVEV